MKFLKTIEEFLLEGRKEDLEKKFIDEFGKGLGECFYDIDKTPNKAYSDWFFNFIKNNINDIGISDTLNKPRKEQDKLQWKKDVKILANLELMLKKYNDNKINLSKPISEIKTLKQFINLLDEKEDFNLIETLDKKEVKIFYNGLEWLVFQPFTFDVSKFANRKDRDKNWCTTYDKKFFNDYHGENGTLIYCVNKLDSTQDIAFQFTMYKSIKIWDYTDTQIKILNDDEPIKNMKTIFDYNSDIYNIIEKVSNIIDFPIPDRNILENHMKTHIKGDIIDIYELSDSVYFDDSVFIKALKKSPKYDYFLKKYGNPNNIDDNEELIKIGFDFINIDDYINEYVENMHTNDLIFILYGDE